MEETINQQFLKPNNENNSNQIMDAYFVGPDTRAPKKLTISCQKCTIHTAPIIMMIFVIDFLILFLLRFSLFFIPLVIVAYILSIYYFFNTRNKIEIEKDENKNVICIKSINWFCCKNKKFELSHFYFHIGYIHDDRKNNHIFYRLFMIKDFENSSEIDLDASNVKNIPIKLYYYLDYIWPNGEENLQKKLNDFIGISPNHQSVFHFNIREYMKLEPTEKEKQIEKMKELNPHMAKLFNNGNMGHYSQYMKFCENYFCYYIEELYSGKKGEILRIDFIYSKNFERIFIGLVNNNEKSYKNTFEFQMNSIDKFILQKIGYEDKGYILKVNLKNSESLQIYSLKNATQENLRGLVYLLNEKLGNINNNQIVTASEDNSPPTANIDS